MLVIHSFHIMTCGRWCSSLQWCGFCLYQNTIFHDRELRYMALSSLKMIFRLFDTVRNSWSILPHAWCRRFKSSSDSSWANIGRYENRGQLSFAFLKWCVVLQALQIAFLLTFWRLANCVVNLFALSFSWLRSASSRFMLYAPSLEKFAFPSKECLFWWSHPAPVSLTSLFEDVHGFRHL